MIIIERPIHDDVNDLIIRHSITLQLFRDIDDDDHRHYFTNVMMSVEKKYRRAIDVSSDFILHIKHQQSR
jgi:hypothetical protein